MNMSKNINYYIMMIWLYLICFIFLASNILHAANIENERWSFNFKNCTISDALNQIEESTGIKIFTNGKIDENLFDKYYKNVTIHHILRNLFRTHNSAMVWNYGKEGLQSISIWVNERGSNGIGFSPKNYASYANSSKTGNVIRENVRIPKDHVQIPGKTFRWQNEKTVRTQVSERTIDRGRYKSGNLQKRAAPVSGPIKNKDGSLKDGSLSDKGTGGPPPPPPEKVRHLEPPPMPPGLTYSK